MEEPHLFPMEKPQAIAKAVLKLLAAKPEITAAPR